MSGVETHHKRGSIKLPTRDLSTGGPAQPGEITFDGVRYVFAQHPSAGGEATLAPGRPRQYLRLTAGDAVPGQANTYYIDKLATDLGHNVVVDDDGVPLIRVVVNGAEQLWAVEGSLGDTGVGFTVVRSLSTGPEGFAAVGSLNAVKFSMTPPGTWTIWYTYQRKEEALP